MKLRRASAAFTLVELLAVILIVGVIAGLAMPLFKNFQKGDAMLAAARQMLDAVHRARQLAISQHTTVYLVFVDPGYWNRLSPAQYSLSVTTNLADKQLTGYNFVSLRTVGDQPGQNTARYFGQWQTLPESIFIAEDKFRPVGSFPILIYDPVPNTPPPAVLFRISVFDTIGIPFPTDDAPRINMPCIGFDYLGRLVSGQDEYIPLAHGSLFYAKDPGTRNLRLTPVSAQELLPGNSTNISFNVIHVDWLTGHARLERQVTR